MLAVTTPKKLRNGIQLSLAQNGFIALPSWMGGLIFQWGRIATPTSDAEYDVTFPMMFPTSCLNLQASIGYTGARTEDTISAQVGDTTRSGFKAGRQDIVQLSSRPSAYISYFAVGV